MTALTLNVLTQGGIGDVILLTPSLRAWKHLNPNGRLLVKCPFEVHRQVLLRNPHIDDLRTIGLSDKGTANLQDLGSEIKLTDYGMHFPIEEFNVSAQKLIAKMLQLKVDDLCPEIFFGTEEVAAGAKRLARLNMPVAIHTTPKCFENKAWTDSGWTELIKLLPQFSFIQLGEPGEKRISGAMEFFGLTLRESLAVLKHCKAFVGIDSAFAHAAAAFRLPAVVLFGATDHRVWGHFSAVNLRVGLDCSPCRLGSTPCPINRKCMTSLMPETVADALVSAMKREPSEQTLKVLPKHLSS